METPRQPGGLLSAIVRTRLSQPDRLRGFVCGPIFLNTLPRSVSRRSPITARYNSTIERGQPPFDPVMMTALLLYSYCCGIYSSRRIAKGCRERVDFMSIVEFDAPDFRTISEFRKRHLEALSALYLQVLQLCETAGLVKLGHVALDGTKSKAN